ncbi:transglutaminase family protein [Actibacterium lipolyticum]|uniref:Transglutaminase-like superfamily protein n=1 Tax=Actibacterium lipolyticum TaxID=1524263 RepID=A0A238JP40_9RHOB|nr:transglutaminase family protein [Actibacterium lipolyticum]SMX32458.1 Transglutaminase-like superfamily protein [Actibacterium lipolyticum]
MRLKISHRTTYSYERPVAYGLQELRLTPKSRPSQRVHSWDVSVQGGNKELEFDDHHMNHVALLSFDGDGHEISIICSGEVETFDTTGVIGKHAGFAPLWYFEQPTDLTRAGNLTRKLTKGLLSEIDDPLARLHALSARVLDNVAYMIGHTGIQTSAEDALAAGRGVCQDHAHVFLAAARALGVPARYVSGYLMLNDTDEQDASHAWVEAHVDGIGWVGFDVSNGISPDERYVRVATGLDYREAAPISGLRMGDHGQETLAVDIQVQQQ